MESRFFKFGHGSQQVASFGSDVPQGLVRERFHLAPHDRPALQRNFMRNNHLGQLLQSALGVLFSLIQKLRGIRPALHGIRNCGSQRKECGDIVRLQLY